MEGGEERDGLIWGLRAGPGERGGGVSEALGKGFWENVETPKASSEGL